MTNTQKFYQLLSEVHKIKKKELRITNRKRKVSTNQHKRETSLHKGSVWGIADRSVPFDGERKEIDYKESLRPALILQTPEMFNDYDLVWAAPGTSKARKETTGVLLAEVPPENLKKTTYFLLGYSWFGVQKNFEKKLGEFSTNKKAELIELLKEFTDEE